MPRHLIRDAHESNEMMIKGTVLYSSTGKEDPLELDSMLASVGNR